MSKKKNNENFFLKEAILAKKFVGFMCTIKDVQVHNKLFDFFGTVSFMFVNRLQDLMELPLLQIKSIIVKI